MSTRKRLWRLRRNPLRRRSDRAEAWAALAAGAVMAVGAPFTGLLASDAVADGLRDHPGLHRVSAVSLENAPSTDGIATVTNDPEVPTHVKWKVADGSARTGDAPVRAGTPERSHVTVWLDGRGVPRQPPPDSTQITTESIAAGSAAAGGACFVTLGCYWVVKRRLDASRTREWEREWAAVGPRWSRRD
ncbi:MAG: Rv1733c family protein [Streptomyces sp.]|uniref:Rv1733c family protein n=1 Tax=Streptomyces sp. TaxID=1931 RepID=UPI003D6BC3BD